MPKIDIAQVTRDAHNRIAQIEQPLLQKIRQLEAELEDQKKRAIASAFRAADAESQRNVAVTTLDALIKYLATVKNA